jgi:hypothetical protein
MRLERPAMSKYSSLLRAFLNYGSKKVYGIGTWSLFLDESGGLWSFSGEGGSLAGSGVSIIKLCVFFKVLSVLSDNI